MTLFPPMIIPWLIITNEEKKNKTSVSVHRRALITKRRKKPKPPWPSLVDWPRLRNVEEKYGKNINETSWRTSSWRVLSHQWYQRKMQSFAWCRKICQKLWCCVLLCWLVALIKSHLDWWLEHLATVPYSCLARQTTLPLHDHICDHDCTTSWNLFLRVTGEGKA